jgi:lysophospholipase L1-like esterase
MMALLLTGMIRAQYLVNSTLGTIDHIHPNRAGYLAMAQTIDLRVFAPSKQDRDDDR